MEVSMDIETKINQLKQMEQQLQNVMAQRYQIEMQVSELEKTFEALEKVEEDTDVYYSAGSILYKVKDHEKLRGELADDKETMEIKLKSLEKQEKTLKTSYESLRGQIETSLQMAQGGSG
ncbi:MAG: prefoldin subunit beta [Candidatus Thermoplasmatota archaeon]|nr:prefoldin subunit beta [Candidatus Thermoplasmatota archaeon]